MRSPPVIAIISVLVMLTVLVTPAQSALRVLFSFDETGYRINKIIPLVQTTTLSAGTDQPVVPIRSLTVARQSVKPGQATLIWQSSDGQYLATSFVPDPRIAHSPLPAQGSNITRVGLTSGAWLADGPDQAERVVILLPEQPLLNLAREQWPLWLTN
ncbi:MAG: hypothetical protein KTR32_04655 [Granulosicoccus sp.]|nr:hypothetical protein [Granulosicoccus sp.]